MSSNLRSIKRKAAKPIEDVEEMAVKAKLARQTKCAEEINALLTKYKCTMNVFVPWGTPAPNEQQQLVLLSSILALSPAIQITSK